MTELTNKEIIGQLLVGTKINWPREMRSLKRCIARFGKQHFVDIAFAMSKEYEITTLSFFTAKNFYAIRNFIKNQTTNEMFDNGPKAETSLKKEETLRICPYQVLNKHQRFLRWFNGKKI